MDRKVEYAFGVSSLVGLFISAALAAYALFAGSYAPDAGAMIVSLGAINVALAIIVVRSLLKAEEYWKRIAEMGPLGELKDERIRALAAHTSKLEGNTRAVAQIVHNIQDQMRDRIHELFSYSEHIAADVELSNAELIDLQRTNEMFYLFLVDNVKQMMDVLTGDKCAVTIKILTAGEDNAVMVKTFMRDAISYASRKSAASGAAQYPYYENTAFKEILSGSKRNYFASDDLANEQTYSNSNANWKKSYNATLVCPIRMQLNEDELAERQDFSVLGFLCIDNNKGGLTGPDCVEFAASIADSMYNHLLLFHHVAASVEFGEPS